jgi:hypothetical protein
MFKTRLKEKINFVCKLKNTITASALSLDTRGARWEEFITANIGSAASQQYRSTAIF